MIHFKVQCSSKQYYVKEDSSWWVNQTGQLDPCHCPARARHSAGFGLRLQQCLWQKSFLRQFHIVPMQLLFPPESEQGVVLSLVKLIGLASKPQTRAVIMQPLVLCVLSMLVLAHGYSFQIVAWPRKAFPGRPT